MIKPEKLKRCFICDVEADGQHPLDFNMINFGIVNVLDPSLSFFGEVGPIHDNNGGDPNARAISGISWEEHLTYESPRLVMPRAVEWVKKITEGQRAIFISDNNGFDLGFLNPYFHRYGGENPAGFSSRRIGDFSAGLKKNFFETNGWKKYRVTGHTHNPVDDARGNVEALLTILRKNGLLE